MSMLLRRAMMGSGTVISYDPYFEQVIALLHMDGVNGGTVFTDSSNKNIAYGGVAATTSTTVKKYGTASASLAGATSYIVSGATIDNIISGDFTAEAWVNFNNVSVTQVIWDHGPFGSTGYEFYVYNGNLHIYGGNAALLDTVGLGLVAGVFYHIALTRAAGVLYIWVDGVLKGSGTSSPMGDITGTLQLGWNATYGLNAYVDEVRVTCGTARYTATFTPPTAAFPNSSNQAYTTWNPSDKTGAGSLSNGNLTATGSVGTRGTLSKTSGKWYFETTVSSVTCYIGIQASTASLTNVGDAANSIDYNTSGEIGQSSTYTPVASATTNDVIGVAFDVTANTVTFYKNGTSLWTGSAGITGAVYPWVYASSGACVTNFGATPFKYTIPAGYNPGLF